MRHCPHLLLCTMQQPHAAAALAVLQLINISYTPDPQQQTHHMLLQRANVTDGRTDIVPLHRPCSAVPKVVTIQSTAATCSVSSFAGLLALDFLAAGAGSFSVTVWLASSA